MPLLWIHSHAYVVYNLTPFLMLPMSCRQIFPQQAPVLRLLPGQQMLPPGALHQGQLDYPQVDQLMLQLLDPHLGPQVLPLSDQPPCQLQHRLAHPQLLLLGPCNWFVVYAFPLLATSFSHELLFPFSVPLPKGPQLIPPLPLQPCPRQSQLEPLLLFLQIYQHQGQLFLQLYHL